MDKTGGSDAGGIPNADGNCTRVERMLDSNRPLMSLFIRAMPFLLVLYLVCFHTIQAALVFQHVISGATIKTNTVSKVNGKKEKYFDRLIFPSHHPSPLYKIHMDKYLPGMVAKKG
jgi:hypothetical protein